MAKRRKSTGLAGVTKKDFIAIAKILCENGASSMIATEMALYFKSENPNFDNARFWTAATKGCKR